MADVELLPCGECGMPCRAGEYHPFAACLMFKACHNSETVRANLAPLQAENERLRAEVERFKSDTSFATAISSLRREKERAERLAEALRWAERHCPCGARPESPDTHPHVPGCLVGAALTQEDRNG